MARQGEAASQDLTARVLDDVDAFGYAPSVDSRRRSSELRLPLVPARPSTVPPSSGRTRRAEDGALTDELRGVLWSTVATSFLASADLRRVWTAPPVSGDPFLRGSAVHPTLPQKGIEPQRLNFIVASVITSNPSSCRSSGTCSKRRCAR